jgi:hypothetical protein
VLIAGGDVGGALNGIVPLATSTTSTNAATLYEAVSDAFSIVGAMNIAREATSSAVALPNGKILFAGGSHCYPQNYPKTGLCKSAYSGFQCDALQTAELYDETTQTFTMAGAGSGGLMNAARSGATATLIKNSGTGLDGKVLITGGSSGSTFLALSSPPVGCGPLGQTALNSAEIYDPVADSFTATGTIPGCAAGTSTPACTTGLPAVCGGSGTPSLITSASESGTTVTITSAANPAGLTVGGYVTITGVNNPLYNGFFAVTAIPSGTTFQYADVNTGLGTATGGYAAASTAETPITSASESGTTVTITSPVNPSGLIVGDTVTVAGVSVAGYDGIFTVTAVPSGTTFQYTGTSGLGAGTGGFATANTAQCGLVDSSAQLLNNGEVLVAGGDYIVFLGQSSPQAFLFNPATATFAQTGAMHVAREEPGISILPSGNVLVAGGLTGEAAACAPTPSTPVDFTTNFSAEVYNPTAGTWTLTPGSSSTPGATGGMSVQRIASAELFTTGPDAGLVIMAGGVSAVTTNGTSPNFGTCVATTQIHQVSQSATDLFEESTGLFTPTGTLTQSRGGYGYGILKSGPNAGDLVVVGGECANNSLSSAAIGTAEAYNDCDGGTGPKTAQNDYYELYNQAAGTWTLGANNPSWFTPAAITSASETGTTVTVTMATANPVGLAVGGSVVITGTSNAKYNNLPPSTTIPLEWIVTAIPSSTTFQFTAVSSGLAAATGGTATADTPAAAPASVVLP